MFPILPTMGASGHAGRCHIAELITPTGTTTFSERVAANLVVTKSEGFDRKPVLFSLAGTVHDQGLHTLQVSMNSGAYLGQYLHVKLKDSVGPPPAQRTDEPG